MQFVVAVGHNICICVCILVLSRVTSQTCQLVTRLDFFYDSSQMVSDSEKVKLLKSIWLAMTRVYLESWLENDSSYLTPVTWLDLNQHIWKLEKKFWKPWAKIKKTYGWPLGPAIIFFYFCPGTSKFFFEFLSLLIQVKSCYSSQITRISFKSWLEIYTSHGKSDWLE